MARAWYARDTVRTTAIRLGLFFAVVALIFLSSRLPAFNNFYARLEAGLVRAGTSTGNGLSRLTTSPESLNSRYALCEEDRQTLAIEEAEYISLKQEVSELRALLGYTERTGQQGTVAHVIARAVADETTRVLIDKGANDGLVVGAAAVINDGILFGVVDDVHANTAVVKLVANGTSSLPAAILGSSRTIGLVQGKEGALLAMEFIPQEAELKTNDVVVTSGLDGKIQEGLVIGLVTTTAKVESAPFQQAFIELLYEPREWTTLLILPPPGL